MRANRSFPFAALILVCWPLVAADWKAGAAKVSITPQTSVWMAGFANRQRPSEGVGLDLYARALALEDARGQRAVLVSTDLLGLPGDVAEVISSRVRERYGVPRDRLILNSSHTHCGPVVGHMLEGAYGLTPGRWSDIEDSTGRLENQIVAVVGDALRDLAPAAIGFAQTNASFGVNRRMDGGKRFGPNYAGPADHDVPVLRISRQDGQLRAVIFGYGCHPTTIQGSYCKFHGDYPGVAEASLERRHPGAVALFVQGAGGDVKPFPFGSDRLAEAYGELLAATVDQQLDSTAVPVEGPLNTAFETVPIAFGTPFTREQLNQRLGSPDAAVRRHAAKMLSILDREGRLPLDHPYPLQVWQFNHDLTFIAMGGELLSEYALRLKREYPGTRLWVAGYSNDVFAYIPSLRVLREGGYEGGDAMVYYMQPGPFAASIEETIVGKVHELIARVQGESK